MGPARRVSSNEKSRIQREVLQPYLLFLSLGKKKNKKGRCSLLETRQS